MGLGRGLWWTLGVAAALGLSASAQGLGEHVAAQARPQEKIEVRATYSVHMLRAAGGTQLREYVAPSGEIFGIAWDGPTVPDLRTYLGSHFDEYQTAARAIKRRGPLYVHTGQLVVENSGHMRAFKGRAYLEDAIPSGTTAAVIQ